jgi:RND family efflux transporter MFP subunit
MKRRNVRNILGRSVITGAVLGALVAVGGCARSAAEQADVAEVPEVLTAQARAADAAYELRLPARALPGETAMIFPRVTGFVSERRVDLGDRVESGQLLAIISVPEIDQAVREAEAGLGQARADVELATLHHARAKSLIGSGAISQEEFNDRSGALDVAKAAMAAAQARLASARERQGFREVRAPFAGVIAARNVERGDRVVGDTGSAVPMFELSALDPLRIAVDVPQAAVLQVQPGLHADVTFPELPGEVLKAEVVRSARRISESGGGMRVELSLPNPGDRLPSGMLGQVGLRVPRAAPVALVPISAVVQGPSQSRVAQVDEQSRLHFMDVKIGRNLGTEVEILSGIAAGDAVVLSPNSLLADGAEVRVRAPATAAP